MPVNTITDRQRLFPEENEDPPTYQDATAQGNSYGTFIGPSPVVSAPLIYPQQEQSPAVIVIGGCPSCRVCEYFPLVFSRSFSIRLEC